MGGRLMAPLGRGGGDRRWVGLEVAVQDLSMWMTVCGSCVLPFFCCGNARPLFPFPRNT